MVQGLAQVRPQTFSLSNGLRVVLLEDHERPLVRGQLHLLLDRTTGAVRPGLAPLALRVLGRSDAGSLGADDFDQVLADSGIELTSVLRGDGPAWNLVARSRDQDLALGLLADRVLRPVFDPSILEAQRLACWREAERLETSSPRTKLRLALEPDWTLQALTLDSLTAITYEDLLAFFARVFRPDRAVLVLHGDLGREQAKRLVLLSFGTWTAAPSPSSSAEPSQASASGRIQVPAPRIVPRTQAVVPPPEDLSAEAEALLALLLPDDPVLLPVQLQKEGFNLVATLEGGPSISVSEAEALLLGRLQLLRQRGFTEADLRRARTAWSAGRALSALHPEALLDEALAEARGRAVSPARMEALTAAALNEALRRWLDPARLRTGVLIDPGAPKPPSTQ
jgi:hypothetical protein